MKNNLLTCYYCMKNFNHTNRTPHILIDCGHSLCRKCLSAQLGQKRFLECKQDNKVIFIYNKRISDFPKNHALLSIIEKGEIGDKSRELKNSSTINTKEMSEKLFSREDLPDGTKWCDSEENKSKFLTTEMLKVNEEVKRLDQTKREDFCKIHRKKYELVCIEDNCSERICYECGLFGKHSVG